MYTSLHSRKKWEMPHTLTACSRTVRNEIDLLHKCIGIHVPFCNRTKFTCWSVASGATIIDPSDASSTWTMDPDRECVEEVREQGESTACNLISLYALRSRLFVTGLSLWSSINVSISSSSRSSKSHPIPLSTRKSRGHAIFCRKGTFPARCWVGCLSVTPYKDFVIFSGK